MTVLTETGITTQHLMPLNTAKSIASLISFADVKNYTKALTVIKVVFDGDRMTAIATDRYVGIKAEYAEYPENADKGTIYLDAAAAKFLTGIKVAKGHNPLITFDSNDGDLTIKANDASITIRQFSGQYPAIETLIDGHEAAEVAGPVSFKIELLAKLGKIVDSTNTKVENWQFTLGKATHRPAPVLAKADVFSAIIQPLLQGK
jgi:DNA polymerase III sliding clamp (beta) subunit (PCNA family)